MDFKEARLRMEAKNGVKTDADHILVTSGSQQGLDFSARVFLNPGDVVLLESPSYPAGQPPVS